MGSKDHARATSLLVVAESGGSNGNRVRLWKLEPQRLSDTTGLTVHVCHLPPERARGIRSSIDCSRAVDFGHTDPLVCLWSWEPPRPGVNAKERPRKEADHALDALRYLLVRLDGLGRWVDRPTEYSAADLGL